MITGEMLRDAFISGANNITNHRQQVDALNVFPVPDGDTGTNMSMSASAAKRELTRVPDGAPVSQVADTCAGALLRGARGNSGVILSLLFRGFSRGLKNQEQADAEHLVQALEKGVDSAYKAVMKPTEGTILTVARLASVAAREALTPEISTAQMWDVILTAGREALAKTPEMLPVLKKAGVVDAGGQGLIVIFEGMASVFSGGGILPLAEEKKEEYDSIRPDRNAAGEYEGEITFTYCTEFIILKREKDADPQQLRGYLETIGDCVVVVDDDEIIKTHVHTDNPGNALQKALEFGQLTNIKIENMREQFEKQKASIVEPVSDQGFAYAAVDPSREYGFVAVAAGDGVKQLFLDLGVDNVVSGGQTMNPSTDDILSAVHATPAKTVFVLPNNKNIIMAAEQSVKLADRNVVVLQTRTIPQGLSAMLAFDHEADTTENQLAMQKAYERVGTGQVTFAARDSDFDGHKIKEGELLALENGKLSFTEHDLTKAVLRLVKGLVRKDSSFVTILYGADISEELAQTVYEAVSAKMPEDVEVALINGGQPVYYFIISVE
ncbi:DAK2 domain-containing protein [Anaerotruncus rubiinfantis]|uniref:DAK2 domain-containing protein n=1 Tax=Anaerotruncus rubiinfantis TaxID=1720200 RepID=UPI00189BD0A1